MVEKVYEKVIVTPYKMDGYESLNKAMEKVLEEVERLNVGYNEQYLVRVTIEKLED